MNCRSDIVCLILYLREITTFVKPRTSTQFHLVFVFRHYFGLLLLYLNSDDLRLISVFRCPTTVPSQARRSLETSLSTRDERSPLPNRMVQRAMQLPIRHGPWSKWRLSKCANKLVKSLRTVTILSLVMGFEWVMWNTNHTAPIAVRLPTSGRRTRCRTDTTSRATHSRSSMRSPATDSLATAKSLSRYCFGTVANEKEHLNRDWYTIDEVFIKIYHWLIQQSPQPLSGRPLNQMAGSMDAFPRYSYMSGSGEHHLFYLYEVSKPLSQRVLHDQDCMFPSRCLYYYLIIILTGGRGSYGGSSYNSGHNDRYDDRRGGGRDYGRQ